MKNLLLALILLFSCVAQAQIFNRSKVGSLDALPFQMGNKLYTISSNSIDEIDSNGEIIQSTALPVLNAYRNYKTVLKKTDGNFLVVGSSQAACDVAADKAYFAYEYSPQLTLIDSTHQPVNNLSGVMQVLELNQGRYFVLSPTGYLLLNNQLDTIATATASSLAQIESAIYLGGDEILIYSKTWASSTPMFNILNLNTAVITPWAATRSGKITSLNDSIFALVNLQNGDLFRFQKDDRSYLDSNRLSLTAGFVPNKFQELYDGFVLRGDSGLSVFNKTDLSPRGTYLAKKPLNSGFLSVDGDQLFFYHQNIYGEVTNYHVLEAAKLNQSASNIVEGLILKVKNTSMQSNPHPSGAVNLFQVDATWDLTLLNNSPETIDSVRILWADVYAPPFCNSIYSHLQMPVNGLDVDDSTKLSFAMTFSSVYAPTGTGYLYFNAAVVMANGKVVSKQGQAGASEVINNISLNELSPLADLSLYPNPTTGLIYIDAPQSIEQAEVLNLQGQKVRSFTSPSGLQQIFVEGLAKGVYWLKLKSEKAEATRKIVVE